MKIRTQTNYENTRVMLEFKSDHTSDNEYFTSHIWITRDVCREVINKLQNELKKEVIEDAKNY
jgi:hypothetical protein